MPSGFDRLVQRRSKPPPNPYNPLGNGRHGQYFVPGIGDWGREQNTRKWQQLHPNDGAPLPRRHRSRRGATRPTPGSAWNNTQVN